jgi:hypothetical protein
MLVETAFDNAPAYDENGHFVIKSTCKKCGEASLVSVLDKSLTNWESKHTCVPRRAGLAAAD